MSARTGQLIRTCVVGGFVLFGLVGCGATPTEEGGTPGDGTTGGGGGGAAAGAKCNTLSLDGVPNIKDVRGGTVPIMTGGAVQDGTYHLSKYEWHNEINALHMRKTVMVISGGKVEWAAVRSGEKEVRLSGSVTTAGETINFNVNCPGDEPLGWDRFTVSGSWLVLHDDQDVKTATFNRQ